MMRRVMGFMFAAGRTALVCFLLWVVLADTGARLARQALAALPDFDYAGEVRALRSERRYAEASMVAQDGLTHLEGAERSALEREAGETESQRTSVLRGLGDAGLGALTGQGFSLESAAGAITADFFVVGDIRDLLIQGSKLVIDGEVDPVITALSAVGVATTFAPQMDVAAAVLKMARKGGALTRRFSTGLVTLAKSHAVEPLKALVHDAAALAGKVGPAGAVRVLRLAEEPGDVAKAAAFIERAGTAERGFSTLHIAGAEGFAFLKNAPREAEALADAAVIGAARKGEAGTAFLRSGMARRMVTPHPVLGIVKGFYKGNAAELVRGVLARLDALAYLILAALAAWLTLELWGWVRRIGVIGGAAGGPGRGVHVVARA
ncbi:hypothetical protein BH11PLA1_BH11PLA1_24000 [soil metagenome]